MFHINLIGMEKVLSIIQKSKNISESNKLISKWQSIMKELLSGNNIHMNYKNAKICHLFQKEIKNFDYKL